MSFRFDTRRRTSLCLTLNYGQRTAKRIFQSASSLRDNTSSMPNHYAALDLPTTSSPAEIKKQFYKLSKANHPDLHPNDPTAAKNFVKISEAYATLGNTEKKERYDRDLVRSPEAHEPGSYARKGSYSSATSGPGGRPASGLSRRRTQFRGPPPSFYKNGAWGQHYDKRSKHAEKASHSYEAQGHAASGPAGPGMGPGGFTAGFDNDVPHFDQRAHTQTHEEIERTRHRARRRDPNARLRDEALEGSGTSVVVLAFLLTGLLSSVWVVPAIVGGSVNIPFAGSRSRKQEG